jgi:hypothetical protein
MTQQRRTPSLPLLCAIALLSGACDPGTASRIVNGTSGAIEVSVFLDSSRCGLTQFEGSAQGLLQDIGLGEGVETIAIDSVGLRGSYRLAPAAFVFVDQRLGREPVWCFDELRVTRDGFTAVFRGDAAIGERFVAGEDHLYTFEVTDAMFEQLASTFDYRTEYLGRLRLGMPAAEVRAILGEPVAGEEELWGATDEYGEEWRYPEQGLTLAMMSATAGGAKAVGWAIVVAPSEFTTQRGLGIGSSMADVLRVYGPFRAEDAEGMWEPADRFVAGSVYGGMIFVFTEGTVSEIFLGAAGE